MMRKVLVPFIGLWLCTLFYSCELDDGQNFRFTTLSVVAAEFPDSFELNETYDIEVTYVRPDACTFFEGFDVSRTSQTGRDVVVIGSVLTDDTACAQVIEEVVGVLRFNVIYSDEYTFRFYSGQNENDEAEYLEYTVPVTP